MTFLLPLLNQSVRLLTSTHLIKALSSQWGGPSLIVKLSVVTEDYKRRRIFTFFGQSRKLKGVSPVARRLMQHNNLRNSSVEIP